MNRISNEHFHKIAIETIQIAKTGKYTNKYGRVVDISDSIAQCVNNTVLVKPDTPANIIAGENLSHKFTSRISFTQNTTVDEIIMQSKRSTFVTALNFASAKHPGGAFQNGVSTQEETLARSSALYASLLPHQEMYQHNAKLNGFYSDYMIVSPKVPFFRENNGDLLPLPVLANIITSPAVNLRAIRENQPDKVRKVMYARIEKILAAAASLKTDTLILGAFGCGVFKNDPSDVAWNFEKLLNGAYKNVFRNVIFAIYEKDRNHPILHTFLEVFGKKQTH